MLTDKLDSDLLRFIVARGFQPGDRLPSTEELSTELGVSMGKLREQLEVARSLGLVEVKPRTGIRLTAYDFGPAVRFSLFYALASGTAEFEAFSTVRNHLEAAFWHEAVARLTPADHLQLRALIEHARAKLTGRPVQIPHAEHRALHLTIFSRLANPFVTGLLAAYWDAYEAVGLSMYSDYAYLQEVWDYHARIVEAICAGAVDLGHELLIQHTNLLRHRASAAVIPDGMASIG
ncbi:MAG: FadR family transcriptional regulator [Anaerolineales bacterium]|nr:FadR family transcriptional regulator [Anaerolineales bacterium]